MAEKYLFKDKWENVKKILDILKFDLKENELHNLS